MAPLHLDITKQAIRSCQRVSETCRYSSVLYTLLLWNGRHSLVLRLARPLLQVIFCSIPNL
jgi:hypothetical protein